MPTTPIPGSALTLVLSLTAPLLAGDPPVAPTPPIGDPPRVVERDPLADAATARHYDNVLTELAAADVSGWSPDRQAARRRSLAALRRYRELADFGLDDAAGERQPGFIDDDGRRCAVAWILEDRGEHALVADLAAADNDGFVSELATRPGVGTAIERAGLTVSEAARIQAPIRARSGVRGARVAPAAVSTRARGRPVSARGQPTVGTDTVGTSPAGATTARGTSGRNAASSLRGFSGRDADGRTRAVSGVANVTEPMEDWWTWWEMNKLRWLQPHDLDAAAAAGRSGRYGGALERELTARRQLAGDLLQDLLHDRDAEVRARAAVALGRVRGASALPELLPLLEDPVQEVREAAVLALGATRSAAAVPRLLRLAEAGHPTGGSALTPDVRPLALLSLALARRAGLNPTLDDLVASWSAELAAAEVESLASGPFLYDALVGGGGHARLALATLQDDRQRFDLRCRAAESLGHASGDAAVGPLSHALGSRSLELRRAAALAMGRLDRPLVVEPLRTALELEHEPITRGFLMLALGEQATPEAAEQLLEALLRGNRSQRPFAALALGVHARRSGDEHVQRQLRRELERARSRDLEAALLLACGIARDPDAVVLLEAPLRRSAEPRLRMFAALAMGLIGGDRAHVALRRAADEEQAPLARVGVAQALALYGDPDDTPRMLTTLRGMKAPDLQALVAVAVAFHGSLGGLDDLLAVAGDGDLPDSTRATAVEGLGLMLDRAPGLQLAAITSAANFRTFPDWLTRTVSTYTL